MTVPVSLLISVSIHSADYNKYLYKFISGNQLYCFLRYLNLHLSCLYSNFGPE